MEKLKRKRKNPLSYARPPLKCPCNPSEDPQGDPNTGHSLCVVWATKMQILQVLELAAPV